MTSDLQDQILTKIANKMRVAIDEAVMEPWKYKPNFKIHDESVVDGEIWYTIDCDRDVGAWLRDQPKEWRYELMAYGLTRCQFDIHEKLYTLLALRWS